MTRKVRKQRIGAAVKKTLNRPADFALLWRLTLARNEGSPPFSHCARRESATGRQRHSSAEPTLRAGSQRRCQKMTSSVSPLLPGSHPQLGKMKMCGHNFPTSVGGGITVQSSGGVERHVFPWRARAASRVDQVLPRGCWTVENRGISPAGSRGDPSPVS